MKIADFAGLLKQTMGLDAASIGERAVERAVQQRQLASELPNPDAYWERLSASAGELQELIEVVVVPETWFFREREAFAALSLSARDEWAPAHAKGVMRLLSLPCATGEEPYSMAMALLDAGFPVDRFQIDAIDISARALEHARRGIYGSNSFRGADAGFRDRHFAPVGSGWRVHEAVRRQVRFQWGNLMNEGLLSDGQAYDGIFCRNLLIYFDRAAQDRAVGALIRLMTKGAILFVGASETRLPVSHGLVSARFPLAFAFRSMGTLPARSERAPVDAAPARRPTVRLAKEGAALDPVRPRPDLGEAMRLADEGHLVDAAKSCEAHLRSHGPSAPAFYLLGLVRDAVGNHREAAQSYRKALYLDPRHRGALTHLAFLLTSQGDPTGAAALNNRALRLEPKA